MNKPTRFYSDKQEKKVAKAIGGKQTANSGATAFQKGDVYNEICLVECKTSTKSKKSFTVQEEWLEKNQEEAFAMGKNYHALCFDFGESKNMRYYIVTEREFQDYLHFVREERYND